MCGSEKSYIEERNYANDIINNIKPWLDKLGHVEDEYTKKTIAQAIYHKSGISDFREFDLIFEVIKLLTSNNNEDKVLVPEMQTVDITSVNESVDELIRKSNLNSNNVYNCLMSINGNKVPVLVGLAGAGKSYTALNMEKIIYAFKKAEDKNNDFKKMYKVLIPCSNTSHNEFWGGFDAVSHTCIGTLKYVWSEALKNKDTLYYVILDELLDIDNIRKTFGGSFSILPNGLPKNLVVIGTGNNGTFDSSKETATNMMKDSGVLGRFDLIKIENILKDKNSSEFKYFFENIIDTKSDLEEHIKKFILNLANSSNYADKMLIPRNVINFIKMGSCSVDEDTFKRIICKRISRDSDYLSKELFVDKPIVDDGCSEIELFEEFWYD